MHVENDVDLRIYAAAHDVGRNENVEFAIAKRFERCGARRLRMIAVERHRAIIFGEKTNRDRIALALRFDKNNHARRLVVGTRLLALANSAQK